jgi:hypothetical protein
MPYIATFVKPLVITDSEHYTNDCCVGGNQVLLQILPSLRERYGASLEINQEDWGWFIWFEFAGINFAVDVHTNDHAAGEFQIHLTSRKPRLLLSAKIQDTSELESLRELVLTSLEAWPVAQLEVERVNEKYMPI